MEKSTFFNAIETSEGVFDRTYDAGDFAEYFANFIGNGIYDNGLKVESVTGNRKVSITKGKAFINGYYYWNTTPVEFDVSLPTVNEREDCVVLRLDLSQRRIYLAYKEGTVEATRNNYIYELLLAMVTITSDDIREIPQRQIVDTRFNRTYCGQVQGVVNQIDTTDLFDQYNDAILNWFEDMKGQISSDAAANLYNLIQKQTRRVVDGVGYRVSGVVQPITLNLPAPLTNYKHLDIIVGITTDSYTTGYTNLYFGDDPTRFIQLRHPTRSDPNPYTKISIDILDNQTALVDGVMKDLGGASVIKFKSDVSGNPLIKFWVDAREV